MATESKDKPKKETKKETKVESKKESNAAGRPKEVEPLVCGLVMPIGAIDSCNDQHWADVKAILDDAIREADFLPNLVSYADESGLIHERIVKNLYDNPIVVCDVSGKNPNVMFELGMRLAFDMPAVVVKDDKTDYSFDTSPIEHLGYPRDLRFGDILDFKKKLTKTIQSTHEAATTDKDYSTFLKHFKRVKVAQLETTEVPQGEYILKELRGLSDSVNRLLRPRSSPPKYPLFGEYGAGVSRFHGLVKRINELASPHRESTLWSDPQYRENLTEMITADLMSEEEFEPKQYARNLEEFQTIVGKILFPLAPSP